MYTIIWSIAHEYAIENFALRLIDLCQETNQRHETKTSLRQLRSGPQVIKK